MLCVFFFVPFSIYKSNMDADVYLWDSFAVSMVVDLVIFVFRWLYSVSLPTLCLSLVLFLFPLFNTIHKSKSYWNISSTPTTHNIQHSLQRAIKIVVFDWKNMAFVNVMSLWSCKDDNIFSSTSFRLHTIALQKLETVRCVPWFCARRLCTNIDIMSWRAVAHQRHCFTIWHTSTRNSRYSHWARRGFYFFPICWTMSTVGASCANQSNGKMVKQPSNRENNAV